MHTQVQPTHSDAHYTIGLLAPQLYYSSAERQQWRGVLDALQGCKVNLISLIGGALKDPANFRFQENALYDLVTAERFDGLLLASAGLSALASLEDFQAFYQHYAPLPMVSLQTDLPGIPSVLISDYEGMRDVLSHLIETHGYHRIAFLRGSETHAGMQARYRAYVDTLDAYDLTFDPSLVSPPYWSLHQSEHIVSLLFDERRLRPNIDVDVIVGASDNQLISVLTVLQSRGIELPSAGFDDGERSRYFRPPLTTVRPPFYDVGRQACELLLTMLRGGSVSKKTLLPHQLIIRQSCGCASFPLIQAACEAKLPASNPGALLRADILEELQLFQGNSQEISEWGSSLLDAFVPIAAGNNNLSCEDSLAENFLSLLERTVRQAHAEQRDVGAWQNILSCLRFHALRICRSSEGIARLERVCHQARIIIGEQAEAAQAAQHLRALARARDMWEIGADLATLFDSRALMERLAASLPEFGIPSAYVALYTDASHPYAEARLILAYQAGSTVQLDIADALFPSAQLLPEHLLPQLEQHHMVIKPLYFRETQLGFALFEVGPKADEIYETLRSHISSALQGAALMQQVREHADELGRTNAELRRAEQELQDYRDHLEDLVKDRTEEVLRINEHLHIQMLERKKAEQALLQSEQQYRLMAETVKDGLLILQHKQIVFANAAFASMVKLPGEQLAGQDPANLLPAAVRDSIRLDALQSAQESDVTALQLELMDRLGQKFWAEIEHSAIVWNNQSALLLTVRDITQNKLREMRLEEERLRLRQENLTFKSTMTERYRFGSLVGKSASMQRVYELIMSVAMSDVNVLISGESGTGKELIARSIHQVSARKKYPFVPVNCASIPETLFEREFFGHRKGAFTGADRDKPGFFDRAHQGMLFLDEVTELTPGTQAKLLRVLQDGEYLPLGSPNPKQADVQIVAATNKDCQHEIAAGRLRQDFYYRICVIRIPVPPLRQRKDDLSLLTEHLLALYSEKQQRLNGNLGAEGLLKTTELPAELVYALSAYDWPGNVRELQNVLQHFLVTRDIASTLALIGTSPLHTVSPFVTESSGGDISLPEAIESLERQMIAAALKKANNNRRKTSRILHITPRTLYKKLAKYGLLDPRP